MGVGEGLAHITKSCFIQVSFSGVAFFINISSSKAEEPLEGQKGHFNIHQRPKVSYDEVLKIPENMTS